MTPLYISGFYKQLIDKDFSEQIYFGYIIELFCFTIPMICLQYYNNDDLGRVRYELNELWRDKTLYLFNYILYLSLIISLYNLTIMKNKKDKDKKERLRKAMKVVEL